MPFVIAGITLNLSAAIWYAVQRDWARTMYWVAAAMINGATLLMKK